LGQKKKRKGGEEWGIPVAGRVSKEKKKKKKGRNPRFFPTKEIDLSRTLEKRRKGFARSKIPRGFSKGKRRRGDRARIWFGASLRGKKRKKGKGQRVHLEIVPGNPIGRGRRGGRRGPNMANSRDGKKKGKKGSVPRRLRGSQVGLSGGKKKRGGGGEEKSHLRTKLRRMKPRGGEKRGKRKAP